MTSEDWWVVGARLLGVYFVVIGALTGTGALMMLGMGLPDGTQRWVVVMTPLIQGMISAGAGVWLLSRSAVRPVHAQESGSPTNGTFRRALQLLGIFFLLTGASELATTAVDSYFVGADWQIRASNIASGLVNASAGGLLLLMPLRIAEKLKGVTR